MKAAAAALRDADIPFLLGGGLAGWARGGPPTEHDVDLFVREDDAERALEALAEAGMRPERPPEGWLLKAYHGDTLVDLIFRPSGGPIGDEHFERAEELEVDGAADARRLARRRASPRSSCRSPSRSRTSRACSSSPDRSASRSTGTPSASARGSSPFARAFFTLIEELGIVEPAPSA